MRWKQGLVYSLPIVLLLVAGFALFPSSGRDDAHITYWAAYALSHFGKIVNYSGEAVEQSSSLLQVLLLAALNRLTGLSVVDLGKLTSILFGALTLIGLYVFAIKADSRETGLSAAFIACLSAPLVYWSFSGMEATLTAFVVLMTLLSISQALSEKWTARSLSLTLVWIAALEACRPEMPLVVIGLLAGMTVIIWIARFRPGENWFPKVALSQAVILTVSAMLIFVILVAWRLWVFHSPFPQPVIAKSGRLGLETISQGLLYLREFLSNPANLLLAILSTLGLGSVPLRGHDARRMFSGEIPNFYTFTGALFLVGYTCFVILAGGDWMEGGRFFVPMIAPMSFFAAKQENLATENTEKKREFKSSSQKALCALWLNLFRLVWVRVCLVGIFLIIQLLGLTWFFQPPSTGMPIWTSVDLQTKYNPDSFSWFERHNQVNTRDIALIYYLDRTTQSILRAKNEPVIIMSGQMGMTPYILAQKYFGQINVIDRRGLADRHVTDCLTSAALPRTATGLSFPYKFLFEHTNEIKHCNIPLPDIIFDFGSAINMDLPQDYALAYQIHGFVNNTAVWGLTPFEANTFIIVKRKFLSDLGITDTIHYEFSEFSK